jgi:phosphate transport system substrate-binding protein
MEDGEFTEDIRRIILDKMMMRKAKRVFKKLCIPAGFILLLGSCASNNNANEPTDTREQGTIHISVDESFKPVIDAQIHVYEASYPDTKIIAHYKPEAECLKDLGLDSIRMIITTRGISENERQFVIDSFGVYPDQLRIAFDAIAMIANPASADTFFTMKEVQELVSGKGPKNITPVFDGVRATSTVRYMIDSVLKGGTLGSNVTAAQNSEGVIDYVAQNKNAIGFIGICWIGNKEDSSQMSFLKRVNIVRVESSDNPGGYVQPVQANIFGKRYPMVRDLVYVLKEKHRGLGHGFANFLRGDRGQLIFRRSYLVPGQQSFFVRPATLNE